MRRSKFIYLSSQSLLFSFCMIGGSSELMNGVQLHPLQDLRYQSSGSGYQLADSAGWRGPEVYDDLIYISHHRESIPWLRGHPSKVHMGGLRPYNQLPPSSKYEIKGVAMQSGGSSILPWLHRCSTQRYDEPDHPISVASPILRN